MGGGGVSYERGTPVGVGVQVLGIRVWGLGPTQPLNLNPMRVLEGPRCALNNGP